MRSIALLCDDSIQLQEQEVQDDMKSIWKMIRNETGYEKYIYIYIYIYIYEK